MHLGSRMRPELLSNPELQSALVRLGIWAFGLGYIGLGAHIGYYRVDVPYFLVLFTIFLGIALALLISVLRQPESALRRYLGLLIDILATSLVIQLTQEAISPFYLFYIWIFISAGTRYGRSHLIFATLVSVIAYNAVLVSLDHWPRHPFEATFFLLLLVALPLYQYSLLRRVQQARAEAERANRAKGDFLAFMTHELRTPLTGVIGMTDLLEGTELTAEQREYVLAIARSAELLGALIGDILDLSKIDAQRLQLEQVPFDLRATAKEVCGLMGPQALGKGLELVLKIDPKLPAQLIGDPLRVRQILLNLVGNAVKFTEQGEVELLIEVLPEKTGVQGRAQIGLSVRDTGIGIPPDKIDTIFERFRQADEATTRRFGGSGLGTTIARDLARLMGGIIGVESEVGRGSRFWVQIPFTATTPSPAACEGQPLQGRRILVLERSTTYREWICDRLRAAGASCAAAEDLLQLGELLGRPAELPADLLVIADSPQPVDLAAAFELIGRSQARTAACLCLTYAGRTAQPGGPCRTYLHKPFLAAELIEAATALLHPCETGTLPSEPAQPVIATPARRPDAGDIRILVAEDNEIAAKVITTFLGRLGFVVVRVANGEQALHAVTSSRFDIAFVDLRMPRLDGTAFTLRLRTTETDRHLPIVALTANAAEDTKVACLAAGMDDFLCKPVTAEALAQMVERHVHPARQEAASSAHDGSGKCQ